MRIYFNNFDFKLFFSNYANALFEISNILNKFIITNHEWFNNVLMSKYVYKIKSDN